MCFQYKYLPVGKMYPIYWSEMTCWMRLHEVSHKYFTRKLNGILFNEDKTFFFFVSYESKYK